jgi:hypothetical protein
MIDAFAAGMLEAMGVVFCGFFPQMVSLCDMGNPLVIEPKKLSARGHTVEWRVNQKAP